MRKNTLSIYFLLVIFFLLITACGLFIWNIDAIIRGGAEVVSALIGGVAIILSGIVIHVLKMDAEIKRTQREKQQENYAKLIELIDEPVRQGPGASDAFVKIHLESWVVGSPDVIQATQELLLSTGPDDRSAALKKLLFAMRRDIGLTLPPKDFMIRGIFLPHGHL